MLPIASDSKSAGLLSLQIRGRGDPFFLAKSAGDGARMRRRRSSSGTSNDPDTAKNVFLNSSCLLKTKGIKRTYCSEDEERERERAPDNLLLKNSIELEEEDDENFFFFFEFRFERRGCCCCK